MDIDLDLYRHEVRVSSSPLVRLSAIDISPDRPQRTFVFIHGFGGQAEQWHYQLQTFSIENRVIALDLVSSLTVAFICTYAIGTNQRVFLDVAIVLALITFLGTIAFAQYVERRSYDE